MPEVRTQVEPLQVRIRLLEELLRQLPLLWARCQQERSFFIREPGSVSYKFLKLVYKIEKTVPPIVSQASPD
jgi:hypothetical protein